MTFFHIKLHLEADPVGAESKNSKSGHNRQVLYHCMTISDKEPEIDACYIMQDTGPMRSAL